MSFLTIVVLAILIIAVALLMRRSRAAAAHKAATGGDPAVGNDPLDHGRDGLNRPLPGQRASVEGEVHDAARSHVGGHLEAEEAAHAARASESSGGTGTAVMAGMAVAGGAAGGAAGALSARADSVDADHAVASSTASPDTGATSRSDVAAPDVVADTATPATGRDGAPLPRSNLAAGTTSLAVDGATSSGEASRLPHGNAELPAASSTNPDAARLDGGGTRESVREMIKILNLREGDATRLGVSKEDFTRLWRADPDTPDTLVDESAARLRHMLGRG